MKRTFTSHTMLAPDTTTLMNMLFKSATTHQHSSHAHSLHQTNANVLLRVSPWYCQRAISGLIENGWRDTWVLHHMKRTFTSHTILAPDTTTLMNMLFKSATTHLDTTTLMNMLFKSATTHQHSSHAHSWHQTNANVLLRVSPWYCQRAISDLIENGWRDTWVLHHMKRTFTSHTILAPDTTTLMNMLFKSATTHQHSSHAHSWHQTNANVLLRVSPWYCQRAISGLIENGWRDTWVLHHMKHTFTSHTMLSPGRTTLIEHVCQKCNNASTFITCAFLTRNRCQCASQGVPLVLSTSHFRPHRKWMAVMKHTFLHIICHALSPGRATLMNMLFGSMTTYQNWSHVHSLC